LAKFDVNRYALLGAEARVAELNAELAEIYRAFPALRRARGGRTAAAGAGESGAPRRRRPPMTAAQKKAVSIRMKKYWASRRKAKAQE
jgi:hypothetical protein